MYGIDFGTSNTVVTVREGGFIPSLLYFERDRRPSVGHEAMADYAEALRRWRGKGDLYSRFRFFQAIKLALKDPWFEGTAIFGSRVRVESLAAIFLKEVKRRADEATGSGARRVVLGRPVVLSPDASVDERLQKRFEEAARAAGFEEVDFVLEPVAASVGADLGGYPLDEDLARARIIGHFGAGGRFRTMTGKELETPAWIAKQVASFYALPLADLAATRSTVKDLIFDARSADKDKLRGLEEFLDRNLAFELFSEIDEAKIELSRSESATIAYAVPPFVRFAELIERPWFEALIEGRVEASRRLVESALAVFTSIASGLLEARERGLERPS
jgi:hypothetical chaperone protein